MVRVGSSGVHQWSFHACERKAVICPYSRSQASQLRSEHRDPAQVSCGRCRQCTHLRIARTDCYLLCELEHALAQVQQTALSLVGVAIGMGQTDYRRGPIGSDRDDRMLCDPVLAGLKSDCLVLNSLAVTDRNAARVAYCG